MQSSAEEWTSEILQPSMQDVPGQVAPGLCLVHVP